MVSVTIRVPSDTRKGGRQQETREFGTTRRQLLEMADWLRCRGVERAGMEATSDYWKPVYFLLEQQGLDLLLYQASQVKALPGRPKTDKLDSVWLAKVTERGSLAGSFVPPGDIRRLRTHTRYRRKLTQARTAEKQRAEKLLEDAIKLSSVVTGLHGVTGRHIMDRLIAGDRDPRALAQLARARARRKIAELEQALEGTEFFTPAHAALLKTMLERIDWINAEIARLSQVVEELLAPYEEQLQQAESMPGWGRRAAQDVIAETGVDMSRFRTPGHLASWAGRTPLDKQSGARKGQRRHKRGNRYIGAVTGETAVAAGKTDTREGARHRRLARRRGKAKACVATGNTQMRVFHVLLSNPGMRYEDPGADWYDNQQQRARKLSRLVGALDAMGYDVTLSRKPGPGPEAASAA